MPCAFRPLTGSEEDVETVIPALETEPVTYASFPVFRSRAIPQARVKLPCCFGTPCCLSLRRGAGALSAGQTRLRAARLPAGAPADGAEQDPVRLLVADDVGVGKTIEAGLIVRELLDRGESRPFAVLCPPHLVEQWTRARSAVSAPRSPFTARAAGWSRISRYERVRRVPTYRRQPRLHQEQTAADDFSACPDFVIVDEAHMTVSGGTAATSVTSLLKLPRTPTAISCCSPRPRTAATRRRSTVSSGCWTSNYSKLHSSDRRQHRLLRERLAGYYIERRRRGYRCLARAGALSRERNHRDQISPFGDL